MIMASVIRVGQSKFVTVPIDEDSSERIMNCIQTLSELEGKQVVHDVFLKDTRSAYAKMLNAQEVRTCVVQCSRAVADAIEQKKAAEKREQERAEEKIVQADDLLTFRQFTKKAVDDVFDVRVGELTVLIAE